MKLSLASSSVLLYVTAVQAFPQAPTNTTTTRPIWFPRPTRTLSITRPTVPTTSLAPVPQTTLPLEERNEYSSAVPAASPAIGEEIAAQVSGLIQVAKVPGDDWEEKKKVLKNLEDSRKAVIERLLEAQIKQQTAEVHFKSEQYRLDGAKSRTTRLKQDLDGLKREKVELEKRANSTEAQFKQARRTQAQLSTEWLDALRARGDALDEVRELRGAIEKIDEAIKNIGVPKD